MIIENWSFAILISKFVGNERDTIESQPIKQEYPILQLKNFKLQNVI